jgi:hypothetical protein
MFEYQRVPSSEKNIMHGDTEFIMMYIILVILYIYYIIYILYYIYDVDNIHVYMYIICTCISMNEVVYYNYAD